MTRQRRYIEGPVFIKKKVNIERAKTPRYEALFSDYHTGLWDTKRKERVDSMLPKNIRDKGAYSSGDLSAMYAFRRLKLAQRGK